MSRRERIIKELAKAQELLWASDTWTATGPRSEQARAANAEARRRLAAEPQETA